MLARVPVPRLDVGGSELAGLRTSPGHSQGRACGCAKLRSIGVFNHQAPAFHPEFLDLGGHQELGDGSNHARCHKANSLKRPSHAPDRNTPARPEAVTEQRGAATAGIAGTCRSTKPARGDPVPSTSERRGERALQEATTQHSDLRLEHPLLSLLRPAKRKITQGAAFA